MHRQYFPACRVDGPIEPPAPYAHLIFRGAVPNKCSGCSHLFEGGCKRHLEILGHYLHLDYGPCGVDGPTDPVTYEDAFVRANVEVPRKCANCRFLAIAPIHGFVCRKDAELWGDFHRGLDWGAWRPDLVYFQLPLPKLTTKALARAVFDNDMIGFVREHRRINPGFSIDEAKTDFATLRKKIEKDDADTA